MNNCLEHVKIGVLDSGLDSKCRVRNPVRSIINYTSEDTGEDYNGHGTSIVRLIDTFCEKIDFYIYKVLEVNVKGKAGWLKSALREAIHSEVDIINLSLGIESVIEDEELLSLLEISQNKGIVLVTTDCNRQGVNYLNRKNIFSITGACNLENNVLYYNSNRNFYINNIPRVIPKLEGKFSLTGANSFITPYLIREIVALLHINNELTLEELENKLVQKSKIIEQPNFSHNLGHIERKPQHNSDLFRNFADLEVYNQSGELVLANVSPYSIGELVTKVELCLGRDYEPDMLDLNDIMFVENLVEKIMVLK